MIAQQYDVTVRCDLGSAMALPRSNLPKSNGEPLDLLTPTNRSERPFAAYFWTMVRVPVMDPQPNIPKRVELLPDWLFCGAGYHRQPMNSRVPAFHQGTRGARMTMILDQVLLDRQGHPHCCARISLLAVGYITCGALSQPFVVVSDMSP